jgi:hypothetical protein
MRPRMMLCTFLITLLTASAFASGPPGTALLEDARSYAAQAGVSVDEALRRLRLQREIGDLDAALTTEEPSTYAGLWIDDKNGYRVVVRFTEPAAEARLRARVAGGNLANLVESRPAKWSLEELNKRRGEVRGHARGAKIHTNSNINVFENRAEIYVLDEWKLNGALARAGAHLPEGVVVRQVARLAEPSALTGGTAISGCTAGFTVQASTGELGILTAGHCNNTQYAQGILLPFRSEKRGGDYDVQWNSACDLLQVTNQFESGYGLRSVTGTRSRNNQAIGTYVCKWGRTTGRTCGWIDGKGFDPDGWLDFNPFDGTFISVDGRGANLADPGDSGGPWFVEDLAYGIHSGTIVSGYGAIFGQDDGKNAVYMAINYVSGLGVSVLTSNPGACNFAPIANFSGGGRIDGIANFNGSTSSDPDGYIVRWEWDFDDGTTGVSTTPTITHAYPPNSGSYWVTLTVTDNEGKRGVISKEICVPTISCTNRLP